MNLYMATTADKYELPLYVCDSAGELAEKFNTSKRAVQTAICVNSSGSRRGIKFAKVEVEKCSEISG